MMPSIEPERDSASPSSRSAVIARFLRALTVFSPVALMLALFLMWKQYQMPFGKAFEICFVAGLTIYIVLGTISSLLLTVARLQPPQVLLRHLLALVSLGIFAALRYIHGLGIINPSSRGRSSTLVSGCWSGALNPVPRGTLPHDRPRLAACPA